MNQNATPNDPGMPDPTNPCEHDLAGEVKVGQEGREAHDVKTESVGAELREDMVGRLRDEREGRKGTSELEQRAEATEPTIGQAMSTGSSDSAPIPTEPPIRWVSVRAVEGRARRRLQRRPDPLYLSKTGPRWRWDYGDYLASDGSRNIKDCWWDIRALAADLGVLGPSERIGRA